MNNELNRLDKRTKRIQAKQESILTIYNEAMARLSNTGINLADAKIVYTQSRKYEALSNELGTVRLMKEALKKAQVASGAYEGVAEAKNNRGIEIIRIE